MHTEAKAGVLNNLEDAPVAGTISRIPLAPININITHTTSNWNSMVHHVVCVEDSIIPPSIVTKGNMISTILWKKGVLILINPSRTIYISNGDHDNPHEPPQIESEGCDISHNALYSHQSDIVKESKDFEKLFYIYQHYQDSEKIHQIDTDSYLLTAQEDSLYPYVNNLLTVKDKYTALLQQELQNPYWNLHDPIMTKSYQISKDMDIETMPHAMYFTGNSDTVTKINQIPYQTIQYNKNGMFTTKLMNDTPIKIFIDNGATPSILPLCTYNNKFPILHTYPKTESNTPTHTGGGMITSHFWLEIPLKLQHQTIQIKALVCDSECPYDLILGRTSMAELSAWQDYSTNKLYIQQISIPLTLRNNVRILPGKRGIVTLTL